MTIRLPCGIILYEKPYGSEKMSNEMFYSMERIINYSDLSPDGVLSDSRAIDFLQDCSQFQLENDHAIHKYFTENHIIMYLVSRQVDYIRRPVWSEKVRVETMPYELKNLYGYRNTIIYGENGEPLIISYATGCFIDTDTRRPVKVTDEFLNMFSLLPKYDMEYTSRKIKIPDSVPEIYERFTVEKHCIDTNHHVNNARYVTMAEEYLSDGFVPDRIRVEYKNAAKYGDIIIPEVYEEDEKCTVVLKDLKDMVFSIVEFSETTKQ